VTRHDWLQRFERDPDYPTMRLIADLAEHADAIHSAVMSAHQAITFGRHGDARIDLDRAWQLAATAYQRAEDALARYRYPDQGGPRPEPDTDRLRDEQLDAEIEGLR
jgi:hypothetical protein